MNATLATSAGSETFRPRRQARALFSAISVQLANSFLYHEAWICVSVLGFYAFYGFAYFVLLLHELSLIRTA